MRDKVCLVAGPFYGRVNKKAREEELQDLKNNNRIRHIEFIGLHQIKDLYYTTELKDCEFMVNRLMNAITSVDYVFLDVTNADTTTALIVGAVDRINITREEDEKIMIVAYAEDERIYDNEYYGLIYTPVSFDQFLIGAIQNNGVVCRTYFLAIDKMKRITKELRIKRRQEEREAEKLAKKIEEAELKEFLDEMEEKNEQ